MAVIFDMDGLLIDSEPLWQEAEIRIFGSLGVELTNKMCMQTKGLRIDEVIQYWYERFPWSNADFEYVENAIVEEMRTLITTKGKAMPGVYETIRFFEEQSWSIGLASSSYMSIIETAIHKLGIADNFEVICSAENEEYGKPHPAIYLSTAEKLGVKPQACIAFEDSYNGLLSAKTANMKTVAVPDHTESELSKFDIADIVLRSLKDWKPELLTELTDVDRTL